MYERSAAFYDAIYQQTKDYAQEAAKLRELIESHKRSSGNTLLDVACGTGLHMSHLKEHYTLEGLDLSLEQLAIAKQRLPEVRFHQADMTTFDLDKQFDSVTCLFSAIGHLLTVEKLQQAVQAMANHLVVGGVLMVEPWFTQETYSPGLLHAAFVDNPDLKISRMSISQQRDSISILDMHYLVGTPEGIEFFTEHYELRLFTHEEYLDAFRAAGLTVTHDPEGLYRRGLYIGVK